MSDNLDGFSCEAKYRGGGLNFSVVDRLGAASRRGHTCSTVRVMRTSSRYAVGLGVCVVFVGMLEMLK